MRLICREAIWAFVVGCLLASGAARAQAPTPAPAVDADPVAAPADSGAAQAQTSAQAGTGQMSGGDGHYRLQENAFEVRLNASVIDSSGRQVDTLDKDAFHVYEDGVPQTIVGFRHEDIPVSIGILIDNSGSMYDKTAAVGAAALDLVKLSNPQDEAFLVDFSSEQYLDVDFTSDIQKLQKGLAYIKPSGGTSLYDAIIASSDYMTKNAKRSKQVLLIITDGEDNASSASLESAIRRVQDMNGPAVYAIGLLFGEDVGHAEAKHARQVLEELCEQTGGLAYFPKNLTTVDQIAHEVAADIRTQYTITYRPTNSVEKGGYRQIHVEAKAKGFSRLQVRTRTGYYPKLAATGAQP
jgi:Ca-activated chloride channel family protein